ncbi:hypothetical protein LZ31DRAFT_552371 [Colletotrichum somersetense]|nr:hypothetical protein LZ31DRAFT_552371 [Colletotrichum somersetense]
MSMMSLSAQLSAQRETDIGPLRGASPATDFGPVCLASPGADFTAVQYTLEKYNVHQHLPIPSIHYYRYYYISLAAFPPTVGIVSLSVCTCAATMSRQPGCGTHKDRCQVVSSPDVQYVLTDHHPETCKLTSPCPDRGRHALPTIAKASRHNRIIQPLRILRIR